MKYHEVNFQTLRKALKNQWKLLTAFILVFASVGGMCGVLYAQRGAANAEGTAQPLELMEKQLDLSEESAYYLFQTELETAYQNITGYYAALSASEFLTEDEQTDIEASLKQLKKLNTDLIERAKENMDRYGAIYVPKKFLPDQIAKYENQLKNTESSLIAAKEAAETVRMMDAPNSEQEDITGTYASLMSQAANYGLLLQQKATLEVYLERLSAQEDEILADCQDLQTMQTEAASELNEEMKVLHNMAQSHAQTHHVNFTITYDENNVASVTMTHTHRAATVQESFLLIFLFCTLTGLCVGAYFAISVEIGACSFFSGKKKQS